MTMLATLAPLWSTRTVREKILLVTAAALASAFVAWYGLAVPLDGAADAAAARHARALAHLAEIETTPRAGIGGFDTVLQRAATAGVSLTRHRIDNPREMTIWAEAADAAAFFGWLQDLQAQGVVVTNVTATRDQVGMLNVEARLARAGA
jgi:type II secretory pathway component PulM